MSIVETDDWKLGAYMEWRPKHHSEECAHCRGRGKVGGGFKDMDGSRQCTSCYGTGNVSKPPKTPIPDLPPALVEHLRRAWWDFLNKPEGEKDVQ